MTGVGHRLALHALAVVLLLSLRLLAQSDTCEGCHAKAVKDWAQSSHSRIKPTASCASCHGPAYSHLTRAAGVKVLDDETRAIIREVIVNPARLDAARSTMVCAQCHAQSSLYAAGFQPGANYYDYFLPALEYSQSNNDAFWPDGRPRASGNEATAFWQSECFRKGGASCLTCHTQGHATDIARNPQLRADNNALCTQCHKDIAADVGAHTHHTVGGTGSSCIDCHMPPLVSGRRAEARDHSISLPAPENTLSHNIPNACNTCHTENDARWAVREVSAWYPAKKRDQLVRRADAFAAARNADSVAIPSLLQLVSDAASGPQVRANAIGYLASFPDNPSAYETVTRALSDPEPLVRATAASAIKPLAAQREALAPQLAALLHDPATTVRVNAVEALINMGANRVAPQDSDAFEQAKQLYRARAELHADDPQQQFAAGKFYLVAGDLNLALSSFRIAIKLDPNVEAQYYVGVTLARSGQFREARQALQAVAPNDAQYTAAQRLEAQIALREAQQARRTEDAKFYTAELLYLDNNYGAALKALDDALQAAPATSWTTKAKMYRAVCLEKLGRTAEAETSMQALSATAEGRRNPDLQLAYVELLYDSGRSDAALKRVDELIAAAPKVPMAYYWRAKVLLQLNRTAEAAAAAEQAIRLQDETPAAHNLLIRIYQLQGRAKEAAQQAQWLRAYQNRVESR